MTDITIYNVDGSTLLVAPITKDATIKQVLMADWYIEIPFTLTSEIPIPKGSYIVYESQKFEIMDNVYPEYQSSTGGYKYVLKFLAQQNHFKRCKVFYGRSITFANRIANEMERLANSKIRSVLVPTYASSEVTFHDTATVRDFAKLIVDNISSFLNTNRWEVGEIPSELDININQETARRELISFDGTSCWDAVNQIAQTFEIEWWTNVNATTGIVYLNFGTCKFNTPIDFKQGEVIQSIPAKKGDTSEYGTRFFVYGGTQNLAPDYRKAENEGGVTNHISEKRLCMRDDDGNYVDFIDVRPNLTPAEIVEQVVKFDDIFPKSEETITEVSTVDRKLSVNGKDMTFKAYVVTCANTEYREELLMKGETLGCKFTSGYLNGREFELSTEKVGDKQFEIIHTTETDGNGGTIILPGGTIVDVDGTITEQDVFKPRGIEYDSNGNVSYSGDTFILTGISLPEKNVKEAENEVFHKGLEYAEKNSSDTDVYDCPTNPVYCTENDCNYNVGQAVKLYSTRFKNGYRDSRIQGYSKKLYNEYIATYTIGDNSSYSLISAVAKQIKSSEISSKEYADNIVRKSERTSNRRYTDAKQTAQALSEANLEYFTEAINPVAVQTMQLIVGSDAQQFDLLFADDGGISYSKATGEISASSATLNHYTVGNKESGPVITYDKGIWTISSDFSAKLEDATKYYWLYIKANKADDTAEYLVSESTFSLDNGDGYYYFLVALFNAEDSDGDRSWTKLYGFTEITPGRVITEKIQSADAKTWIDLKTGAANLAGGKIEWDEEGNVTMQDLSAQNIEAKDSVFDNVTVKGSLSGPFKEYESKSTITFTRTVGGGVTIAERDITKTENLNDVIYIGWGEYYTRWNKYSVGDNVYSLGSFGAVITVGTISEVNIINSIAGENGIGKSDNIAISVDKSAVLSGCDLDWDLSNSGRIIRIANADFNGSTTEGNIKIYAPEGKYFFEDGQTSNQLALTREIVELLGYASDTEFYGWIVKSRKDLNTKRSYGTEAKVIYQGFVDVTGESDVIKATSSYLLHQGKDIVLSYNVNTYNAKKIWVELYLPALKGMEDVDNWQVLVWTNPRNITTYPLVTGGGLSTFMFASVEYKWYDENTNQIKFLIRSSNSAGTEASPFTFQVISSADWVGKK